MNKTEPEWLSSLSAEFDSSLLSFDMNELSVHSNTLSFSASAPQVIFRPRNKEDIQKLMRWNIKWKVPVYPISTGRNWGYGDSTPTGESPILIDLGRMNRILEVNADLAYAVVEPGVTQKQLLNHIQSHGYKYWIDSTGAGPETSIIGNTLDRGFGHTPYSDHAQHSLGFEVILADGSIIQTGFSHFENAHTKWTYKHGIGPSLDGLFLQSNMGIVVSMAVWLLPKPERYACYFFSFNTFEQMVGSIPILRELKLQGYLRSAIHIANDLRVVSARQGYPWDEMNQKTPVSEAVLEKLREKYGMGPWSGCGVLVGSKASIRASAQALKSKLKNVREMRILWDYQLDLIDKIKDRFPQWLIPQQIQQKLPIVISTSKILRGYPEGDYLRGVLWRLPKHHYEIWKDKPLRNPFDTEAGLVWISPTTPADSKRVEQLWSIVRDLFRSHGFDPLVTFTFINERTLVCVANISFHRKNDVELKKAKELYQSAMSELIKQGFYPYRVGRDGFSKLMQNSSGYWSAVEKIKMALDPNQVISPGRYSPGESSNEPISN